MQVKINATKKQVVKTLMEIINVLVMMDIPEMEDIADVSIDIY